MACFSLKLREHQLLMEIRQQPRAILETLAKENDEIEQCASFVRNSIDFLGMGSSYYASLYTKYLLQEVAHIHVRIELSSEFLHYPPNVRRGQVFVVVSQSGESIETVKAARFLRRRHAIVLGVTNQPDSSLAALSHVTLLTHAGEERASATKTFVSTLALLYRLSFFAGRRAGLVSRSRLANSDDRLVSCAKSMEVEIPNWENSIRRLVGHIGSYHSICVIGRGYNLAPTLQGALLFKEVAKVHAEGMTAGEFMHGPIEIASSELLTIVLTGGHTSQLLTGLIRRLKKYNSKVLTIGPQSAGAADTINLMEKEQTLIPFPSIVCLDLLAYFTALKRRLDPDRFNHISKVTLVE